MPPDQDQTQAPPVCYRHPGRPTYVSCVRCGRPACPDCLRPAAVGHQCLDCIKGGYSASQVPAGRFGGRVSTVPRVTYALIAINIVIYLVELAHQQLGYDWLMVGAARQGNAVVGVATGQWYRLITSAFLPPPPAGNWLSVVDIAFNMYALFIVGPAIERVLGASRFLAIYLLSGIGGSILLYILVPYQPAAGASGAIFGLFGAWFVLARRLQVDSRQVLVLIAINLAFGFAFPQIAWQAHVGGLIAGGLLTAAYVYAPRPRRSLLQGAATTAMIALFIVAVLVRNHLLIGSFGFYGGHLF